VKRSLTSLLVCPLSGSPLELEAESATDGEVTWGVLHGPAGDYPIVAGIPIFTDIGGAALDLVRAGRHREAVAEAASGQLPPSGAARVTGTLAALRPTSSAGRSLGRFVHDRTLRGATATLGRADGDLDALLRYRFLDSTGRSPEAYRYFRYRFGTPRHLVALAHLVASTPDRGTVLDLGCGAGHLTWCLSGLTGPGRTLGCDVDFALLLAARVLTPDVQLLCADATALPIADAALTYVFSSDVFTFIQRKATAVREIERVLAPGGRVSITSLINAEQPHAFRGEPLGPGGWQALFSRFAADLRTDRDVLDAYLERRGLSGVTPGDPTRLADGARLSVDGVRPGPPSPGHADPGPGWAHGRGTLAVNPLYGVGTPDRGTRRFELQMPSSAFERDNADLHRYLPDRFAVTEDDLRSLRSGHPTARIDDLLARCAVLGLPPAVGEAAVDERARGPKPFRRRTARR
jgi:SAM-dependent methyltransferase/uncharacterized protein YbaR (Trm112 family)